MTPAAPPVKPLDVPVSTTPESAAPAVQPHHADAQFAPVFDSTKLADAMRAIVGPAAVLTSRSETLVYECDGFTIEKNLPDVVVFPTSTQHVADIVKACNRLGVPFVARGAGTSLAGGTLAVGGGVMISLTRMKKILKVDPVNRVALVESGVVNQHLSDACSGHALHFAPDPSSQRACTIGGNVATNSGGPHTLKYGVTVNHVLGVEMVLPDGEIVTCGGPAEDNPGYDLTGLITGSEGTLGIVTACWVRLTPNAEAYRTLLAVFPTVEDATNTISDIVGAGVVPAALEMIDKLIIGTIERRYKFGFPLDCEAVLIMEVDGLEAGLDDEAARVEQFARKNNAREVRKAETAEQRALLWKCRKSAFGTLGYLANSVCTQDGVVPRTKLPEIMRAIRLASAKHNILIANVFHAGDGNIHPVLLFDERDPDQVRRVLAASHDILDECINLGGSVTGEHGIGVEKLDFMAKMFAPADLDAMRRIRDAVNPGGLCSPKKMLPSGGACVEGGIRREKPSRTAAS